MALERRKIKAQLQEQMQAQSQMQAQGGGSWTSPAYPGVGGSDWQGFLVPGPGMPQQSGHVATTALQVGLNSTFWRSSGLNFRDDHYTLSWILHCTALYCRCTACCLGIRITTEGGGWRGV